MNKTTRDLGLSVALLAIAGWVDAVGYLRLTHLFVSFMSGNSTQLAIAAVHGDPNLAWRAGAIVAVFVLGAFIGRLIETRTGGNRRRDVLALEAALLGLAALLSPRGFQNVFPMVAAMGLQNAAWHNASPLKTSRTFVTGVLVSLGEGLADALSGPRFSWTPHALMWLGLVAGAALGAFAYSHIGLFALALPALGAAALCVSPATQN
jgi:uncharacterized membrane protein YoaK (UPF0700 family)